MRTTLAFSTAIICACLLAPAATAQYVVENLGRGLIAIRASETSVYVDGGYSGPIRRTSPSTCIAPADRARRSS